MTPQVAPHGARQPSRNKHHLRALFRSFSFLVLVGGYCMLNIYNSTNNHVAVVGEKSSSSVVEFTTISHGARRLEEEEAEANAQSCEDVKVADPQWYLIFYVLGVLYMFLALAVVCDEFFVPALEEMSSSRHLNLSMDVAGATLMAAGGSAPELFTALFGTFQESAVGFGTIVGSAVFNVLFVIGMCSLLSKELLQLTWWPLFRDSIYYLIGLAALATFVGVTSEGLIEFWEAAILFLLYIGYVIVMAFNEKLYGYITGGKRLGADDAENRDFVVVDEKEGGDYVLHEGSGGKKVEGGQVSTRQLVDFRWHGSFRAGILKLIKDPSSWSATAGANMVSRIEGDVDDAFSHVDTNNDKFVDKDELQKVLQDLDCHLTPEEFEEMYSDLDKNKDGKINKDEFKDWYVVSEKRMLSQMEATFHKLDSDKSGALDRSEIRTLLHEMDSQATEEDIDAALLDMCKSEDKDKVSFEEFSEWYVNSLVYQHQKQTAEEESEGIYASLRPPKGQGCLAWTRYIVLLPLVVTLAATVPDVRRPHRGKYCYLSFVLAIAWIGLYSYFMVDWAEVIGATLGIPAIIMGLTFLAAGTSVPDLLSSVIVARRGEGDMAVSSSIGSNIFDILVGLPLPWIAYTLYPGKPSTVTVGSEGVGISICILVGMIVLIIATIHLNGWKLTKAAGIMMFVFYIAFLVQAIWRELPFETCV